MKKIIVFGTLLLIFSGVSLLSAQNEAPPLPVIAKQPDANPTEGTETIGRLVRLEGTVNFRPSFSDKWKPATLQTTIGAGQ